MEPLVWLDEWSVGNPSLDHDHQCLVEIINRVGEANADEVDPSWVIRELSNYATYHFQREEEMMEAAQIPGLEEHKQYHQKFIDWLASIEGAINQPEAQLVLFDSVNGYLRAWLERHILGTDMQYKGKL